MGWGAKATTCGATHCFTVRKGRLGGPIIQLVRYADDFVALAKQMGAETIECLESRFSRNSAKRAPLGSAGSCLSMAARETRPFALKGKFQLEINREKTRVVDLREEGASLDILRYPFRFDRDGKGRDRKFLNVFPSKKAVPREREKLREMTNSHPVL